MELNAASIHDVIHPTAAFSQTPIASDIRSVARARPSTWLDSQLNPKNRIDSLAPLAKPLWRIDGCTALGTQFYAVPLFLGPNFPPLRFDVFISEREAANPLLRQLLDISVAFHTKDPTRLNRLGIARHILRILQVWTLRERAEAEKPGYEFPSQKGFAQVYNRYPFGSHIVLENLDIDVDKVKVTIAPAFYLERQLIALKDLPETLALKPEAIPPEIDLFRLSIVQQLHDSVCVVRIRDVEDDNHDRAATAAQSEKSERTSRLWILKALTSGTKFLYCELRNLLQMVPHRNIISKPEYLITKNCSFGNKIGVVGFLLPYHEAGSLRDTLPLLRIHGKLTRKMQLRWALGLGSAISHIRNDCGMFYPDLRLDNILRSDKDEVVMVDFEQRGVWCEFAAPEINAISYVHILAVDGEHLEEDDEGRIPFRERERFMGHLYRLLPDWKILEAHEDYCPKLHDRTTAFNVPWMALDSREQEAAEVYMLGRVLWCIFEGQCAPQNAAVWQSYKREPEYEFPEYRHTPPMLQELIDDCTKGRRATLSNVVTRVGSKLYLRTEQGIKQDSTAEEVRAAAKNFWGKEVEFAEGFIRTREQKKIEGSWDPNSFWGRPCLAEVMERLIKVRV